MIVTTLCFPSWRDCTRRICDPQRSTFLPNALNNASKAHVDALSQSPGGDG